MVRVLLGGRGASLRRGLAAVLVAAAVATTAEPASAQTEVDAEACPWDEWTCARTPPLHYAADDSFLPIDFDFDTGFIPSGSPIQVRLAALLSSVTYVELSGEFRASWLYPDTPDDSLLLEIPGLPEGGAMGYHWGLETAAEGKIDVSVSGVGVQWQGPIPFIPQIDFSVQDDVVFDDWGWDPGVRSTTNTPELQIAEVDLVPLLGVNIPGIAAGFRFSVAVEADVMWITDRLVVRTPEGADVVGGAITATQPDTLHDFLGGASVDFDVHPEGRVDIDGTLHFIPAMFISFLGQSWSFDIADIPIPLPSTESDWVFEPQRVHVPLPDVVVEEEEQVLDLGTVVVGSETYATYHLRNEGEARALVQVVSTDPVTFPLWDEAIEVDAGASSKGTLRFIPTEEGEFEAQVNVVTNDPDDPVATIAVRGVGVVEDEGMPLFVPAAVEAESGCGCAVVGEAPAPDRRAWAWALLGVALLRRRRRGAAPLHPG